MDGYYSGGGGGGGGGGGWGGTVAQPNVTEQYNQALQAWQGSWTQPQYGYLAQGLAPQEVVDTFVNYWTSQGIAPQQLQTDVTGVLQNVGVYPQAGGGSAPVSGGGGGGGGGVDTGAIASYSNQIQGFNDALGLLGPALDTTLSNLRGTRTDQENDVARDYALAQREYDTQRRQTTEDRTSAVNNSLQGTASRLNAIQRLLGTYGSGNSSAYLQAAPQISARAGSRELFGLGRTYGRNLGLLDQAFSDTEENRLRVLDDIERAYDIEVRKAQAQNKLDRAGLLEDRRTASINRDLASGIGYQTAVGNYAGDQNTINQLLTDANSLNKNPSVPTIGKVGYAAPDLSKYTIGGGGRLQVQTPQNTGVNPLLAPILDNEDDLQY